MRNEGKQKKQIKDKKKGREKEKNVREWKEKE